ncbi:hypothetical protein ACFTAO_34100 [Paenibacillus rhizoplanae]
MSEAVNKMIEEVTIAGRNADAAIADAIKKRLTRHMQICRKKIIQFPNITETAAALYPKGG